MTLLIAAITTSQTILRIERRLKREELSEESARSGQSEQREQKQREARGQHRLLRAEPGIVANLEPLFALLAQMRKHQKRADLHQRIGRKIEKNGGDAQVSGGGKRDQDVACVSDRRICEHALDVRLHERREIADDTS